MLHKYFTFYFDRLRDEIQCCQVHGFIHNLWIFLRGRMDEGKSIEFCGFLNVFDLTQLTIPCSSAH